MKDVMQQRCNRCQRTLPLKAFSPRPERGPFSVRKPCRDCRREQERLAPRQRDTRAGSLWQKYRMSVDDYDRMLSSQGGVCAICGTDKPGGRSGVYVFMVDHDHGCCPTKVTCGTCVRGLLCMRCNVSVGRIEEMAGRRAIEYIVQHALRLTERDA